MQCHTLLHYCFFCIVLFKHVLVHAEIQLNTPFVLSNHGVKLRLLNTASDVSQHKDLWLFGVQSNINPFLDHSYSTDYRLTRSLPDLVTVYDYFVMKKLAENKNFGLLVNANFQTYQYNADAYGSGVRFNYGDSRWSHAAAFAIRFEDTFLLGSELRNKTNLLYETRSSTTQDYFVTWSPNTHFSMTGSYVELDNLDKQANLYLHGEFRY